MNPGADAELGVLSQEVKPLLELLEVFERWYAGMDSLQANNAELHQNSLAVIQCMDELYQMHSQPNNPASKETVEQIYARAKIICQQSQDHIAKGELVATVTFQDIQATCRMILTQIHNLQTLVENR